MKELECDDNKFLLCLIKYILTRKGLLILQLKEYKKKLESAESELEKAKKEKPNTFDIHLYNSDVTKYSFLFHATEQFIDECRLALDHMYLQKDHNEVAELIHRLALPIGDMEALAVREKFKKVDRKPCGSKCRL